MADTNNPGARLAVLGRHLAPAHADVMDASLQMQPCAAGANGAWERLPPQLDDVVIIDALRTPMTKARRGGLKDTTADDLLCAVFEAIVKRTGVEPAAFGDIVVGSVLGPSAQRATEVRIAGFLAGYPETVTVRTVNRQCSSGLQAVADVAAAIRAGYYEIGLAGGVETMSINPMTWDGGMNPRLETNAHAKSCLFPMGITSENVAAKFGIDRDTQDKFAVSSHRKAAAAQADGKFDAEIVPVTTNVKDPKTGEVRQVTVARDDGVRAEASVASLARLPPAFKKGGSTTAGNSSQVTDGASAVLLASRREALRRGLPILGTFRSFAVAGVDPAIMGIGPAAAIPKAVAQANLTLADIDVFEINEAFASQATYCVNFLGIPEEKVNPNGGAIALGHPLGNTGSRATATLLHEMKRRGRGCRFGIVSMCIGSGMGAAAVFEREGGDEQLSNTRAATYQGYLSRNAVV